MGEWKKIDNRAAVGRALRLRREINDFEARWPTPMNREEVLPAFSWIQLERQLVDLSATPAQAEMAKHLVSATRKMAHFKPPEMVLRELLCMTWVLLDENFRPEASPSESASMT